MAETYTEDIQSWGGLASARLDQVKDELEMQADPEAHRGLLQAINADVAGFIGTLNTVIMGEDIRILDEDYAQLYRGRMAVRGRFAGALLYTDDPDEGRALGYALQVPPIRLDDNQQVPDITIVEGHSAPAWFEKAAVAIGPMATTDIFAVDDIFRGNIDIDPKEGFLDKNPHGVYKASQLERREQIVDRIARDTDIENVEDLQRLGFLFTDPKANIARTEQEQQYFMRRVNVLLQLADRWAEITTRQIYAYDEKRGVIRGILEPGRKAIVGINSGLRFVIVSNTNDGARMACLLGHQTDANGEAQGMTIVDVDDISQIFVEEL